MGLGDSLDTVALVIMVASLGVGFWESSSRLGSLTNILDSAVANPLTSGLGTGVFTLSLDVWTPGIAVANLPSWLQWVGLLYPFAEGFIPHFSTWTCLFALFCAFISTWVVLHVTDWSFWGKGFLVTIVAFGFGWYVFQLLAWWGLGWGADLLGLGSENAYNVWRTAVNSTQAPALQYFFFASIPLSLYLIYRKFVGALI